MQTPRVLDYQYASQHFTELRGLYVYATGLSHDGRHCGLQTRHARLAVGTAATLVDFVTEAHMGASDLSPQYEDGKCGRNS